MPLTLNSNMDEIIDALFKKGGKNNLQSNITINTYKTAIIILVVSISIAFSYVHFLYNPIKQKNQIKQNELQKILAMQMEILSLNKEISELENTLNASKEEYRASLDNFDSGKDLGDLYETVSQLSKKHHLVLLNIIEAGATPYVVKQKKKDTPPSQTDNKIAPPQNFLDKQPVIINEVKVNLKMKGGYTNYISFKEDLAQAESLLKINSETVMVKDEKDAAGNIHITLELSAYAIDKTPFEGILQDDQKDDK